MCFPSFKQEKRFICDNNRLAHLIQHTSSSCHQCSSCCWESALSWCFCQRMHSYTKTCAGSRAEEIPLCSKSAGEEHCYEGNQTSLQLFCFLWSRSRKERILKIECGKVVNFQSMPQTIHNYRVNFIHLSVCHHVPTWNMGLIKAQLKVPSLWFVDEDVQRKAFQMELDCHKSKKLENISIPPLTVMQLSRKSTLCF